MAAVLLLGFVAIVLLEARQPALFKPDAPQPDDAASTSPASRATARLKLAN
jgi:hypothetical protein